MILLPSCLLKVYLMLKNSRELSNEVQGHNQKRKEKREKRKCNLVAVFSIWDQYEITCLFIKSLLFAESKILLLYPNKQ
jgi:hypothetical protein